MLFQEFGEVVGRRMAIADLAHARRLAAKMHAGVIEPVGENQRLGAEYALVE